MSDPQSPLVSIKGAEAFLLCSRRTIYRLVKEGELTPTRVRKKMRFTQAELDRFVKRNTRKAA